MSQTPEQRDPLASYRVISCDAHDFFDSTYQYVLTQFLLLNNGVNKALLG